LLWQIAADWGANPAPDEPLFRLWRRIGDRIVENRLFDCHTVILLDDAQAARAEVLVQMGRLVQCDPSAGARLTVVLSTRPEHLPQLGPQLTGLAELCIQLGPWEESDTADYVESALSGAGREVPVFAPEAVARIHKLAQGVPRRISQLAELSLLAGLSVPLDRIGGETVDSVYRELIVADRPLPPA
jgi:general secretion pathway protein A